MMSLIKVLASGSSGNCYIIQAGNERLILECGISYREILKGMNYNIKGTVGCLVSHRHLDHCKSFMKIAESVPRIVAPIEVLEKFSCANMRRSEVAHNQEIIKLGGFTILPFNCNHTNTDGTECENMGYLIQHKDIGKILFATDTYYLKYKFKEMDHILIECNYSEGTIGELEPYKQRIFKSHMSLETLKNTLITWDLSSTETITLIHLSKANGEPKRFKKEIEKLTGIPTYVAEPGVEIN